jgi:hypothetical protein
MVDSSCIGFVLNDISPLQALHADKPISTEVDTRRR